MITACWSVKGGQGTTVVATALAALCARSHPSGALVADLAGDVPAALGTADPVAPGVAGWVAAGREVPPDALGRLEHRAGPGLSVLPRGPGALDDPGRGEALLALLAGELRPVVVDCGRLDGAVARVVAASASRSLLVLRPCYLAVRRSAEAGLRPSGVVLVSEPGRALGADDVATVVGSDVVATVAHDLAVARAVDAGTLSSRVPRPLVRALRAVAEEPSR